MDSFSTFWQDYIEWLIFCKVYNVVLLGWKKLFILGVLLGKEGWKNKYFLQLIELCHLGYNSLKKVFPKLSL